MIYDVDIWFLKVCTMTCGKYKTDSIKKRISQNVFTPKFFSMPMIVCKNQRNSENLLLFSTTSCLCMLIFYFTYRLQRYNNRNGKFIPRFTDPHIVENRRVFFIIHVICLFLLCWHDVLKLNKIAHYKTHSTIAVAITYYNFKLTHQATMVSVCPFVRKTRTRCYANVAARKTKYAHENNDHQLAEPGVSS